MKRRLEQEDMEIDRNELVNRLKRLRKNYQEEQMKKQKQNKKRVESQMIKDEIENMETGSNEVVNEEVRLCKFQLKNPEKKQKQNGHLLETHVQEDNIEEKSPTEVHPEQNECEKKLKDLYKNLLDRYDSNRQSKLKKLMNLVKQQLFEEKHSKIKGQFTFDRQTFLFIDIVCSETKPDFIDTVLCGFDEHVQIRHHWKIQQSRPYLWEGAVAVFETPEKAMKARSQLKYFKYLTAVYIQEVLDVLIEAEIRYSESTETSTIVIIRGEKPFPPSKEKLLSKVFERFGQVTDIKFEADVASGEICQVRYRYASHAIMAKFFFEKSTSIDVGRLSAEIIMTSKETSILEYMRNYLRDK